MKTEDSQTMSDEEIDQSSWANFWRRRGVNPNLLMLKITLFMMHGATSCLLPYLTIHMQSVGLTLEEISFVYLALPFTTFVAPPITGFLVDKFGKYKPVVIITFLLNAIFHHALFMIPQQEIPGRMPSSYVMRHPVTGNVEVWWSPCPSRECPEDEEINIVVDSCIDHCILLQQDPSIKAVAPLKKSPTDRVSNNMDDLDDLNFKVSKKKPAKDKEQSSDPVKEVPPQISTESSAKNGSKTFAKLAEFLGTIEEESEESWVAGSDEAIQFLLDMHEDLGEAIEHLGKEREDDEDSTAMDFIQRFGEKLLWSKGVNVTELQDEDLRCGGIVMRHNITITEERLKELAEDCMIQKCEFLRGGPDLCPPDYNESDDKILWIYFLLRFLGTVMLSGGVTMMDPIALISIEKYGGDFGRERLFSMFGMAIFSPITGLLIDYYSTDYTDYSAAFYMYDILLVISSITVYLMPLGEKLPADNVFKDMWKLLKKPHVICFILFLFVLGNFWGFIESFLFLYLKELGTTNSLLGITITVGTISSIPLLYTAEKITRIFGHVNLIVFAFFAYACRLMGYSFIENSWWCIPFEAMEAFSCHLMWVAAATYCSILAPRNLLATLIGVLGMAHFYLGRGSGSFMGGFLIGEIGTREAFRYMGLVAVAGGLTYKVLHIFWLKKFNLIDDDMDAAENGESEKLSHTPKMADASTSMSSEGLSVIVKHNQVKSLTSLSRNSKDIESFIRRRSSYTIMSTTKGGSASKVDLLRSAIEINHARSSNMLLRREDKGSADSMNSSPKLFKAPSIRNISHSSFHEAFSENEIRDVILEEAEEP